MIDEKKLAEMRKHFPNMAFGSKRTRDDFEEMLDTLEALWKVARAAEAIAEANRKWGWYEIPSKGEYLSHLFAALSALKEKA